MVRTDRELSACFAVLGLPETANRAEVVKAYRRLARANHPDVSSASDAALRFEAIENAYRHALHRVPVHATRSSAPLFDTSPPDQIWPIDVDLGRAHGIVRPAIIPDPVLIEPPRPRMQPLNTDRRGATDG